MAKQWEGWGASRQHGSPPAYAPAVESSLYILGYNEPAVVGTAISFNCSEPGKVLTGPNSATCTEDGQWVPDPSQLQMNCKGIQKI